MNDNQKAFLKELKILFDKYNIDEMLIFNDRITMSSNSDVLAFRAYIRKNDDLSYFTDITTTESRFDIMEG
ncbi:MAG: hypothetical protein J6S85_16335 [Methanobrevibacter sp.]|nr:hypothetical protein [Methanobrevibacter sp.]